MNTTKCICCQGIVTEGKQKYHHLKKCKAYKGVDIDHLECAICGFRSPIMAAHLRLHGVTIEQYLQQYPTALLTLPSLAARRGEASIGTHSVPIEKRAGCVLCEICGEKYLERFGAVHVKECLEKNPEKHSEGKTYVRCPECGYVAKSLGMHLKKTHGWNKKQIQEVNSEADVAKDKFKTSMMEIHGVQQPFRSGIIKAKRQQTWIKNYGADNPWKNKEIQDKIKKTNLERFGVEYPMQSPDIQIKQYRSSKRGLSDIEEKFVKDICAKYPSVVFTGYGGRVISFKKPVEKNGRLFKCANPDFMIFPNFCLEEASAQSRTLTRINFKTCKSRFVIELFGDWFHSERITGIPTDEHKKQVIDAYKSAGIECLVLWGTEIKDWESVQFEVEKWIEQAIFEMNDGIHSDTWKSLSTEEQTKQVDEFIQTHPEVPTPSFGKAKFDFDRLLEWSKKPKVAALPDHGQSCCKHFVKSMVRAKAKGLKSIAELWADKSILKQSLYTQLREYDGFNHPMRIRNAIQFKNGFRSVSNLSPTRIVTWLQDYAVKGGVFYDPCAGWGGRMLAAHCMGMKYRAIDANKELVDELNNMAKILGIDSRVVYGDSEKLEYVDSVLGGEIIDLAFTSLPYFDREWYSDDINQSIQKYPDKKTWMETFPSGIFVPIVNKVSLTAKVILNAPLDIVINNVLEEKFVEMKSSHSTITEKLIYLR